MRKDINFCIRGAMFVCFSLSVVHGMNQAPDAVSYDHLHIASDHVLDASSEQTFLNPVIPELHNLLWLDNTTYNPYNRFLELPYYQGFEHNLVEYDNSRDYTEACAPEELRLEELKLDLQRTYSEPGNKRMRTPLSCYFLSNRSSSVKPSRTRFLTHFG